MAAATRTGRAPRLTGAGFVLDEHRDDDAAAMLAGADGEIVRWINEGHVCAVTDNLAAIARWRASWAADEPQRTWAVRDAETGELAGGCELRLEGDGIAGFSYWIFPEARGRGWAAAALALIVDFAFTQLGVFRANLMIEPGNTASHRVARDAGFRREGLLRDYGGALHGESPATRHDFVSYSRLPRDAPASGMDPSTG